MYLPSLTGPMRPTPLNDQVAGPLKFLRQVRDSMTFMRYANPTRLPRRLPRIGLDQMGQEIST